MSSTQENQFTRVQSAYDLPLLSRCRVVVAGVGGARGFVEDLARTGIGEIGLIDPDLSSATNIGTQAAYHDEIGQPKVEALKRQLQRINPKLLVTTRQCRLEDVEPIEHMLLRPWLGGSKPQQTVLVLTTDNFWAHAYGNRLALHFGLPSVGAAVYQNGEGAEISYTHPQVTRACHRCVLESRYRAYLKNGYRNNVTSAGSPVFVAARVNALLGMVTMALLHHGSDHPRWGNLLKRMDQRNLLLLKLWPDFSLPGIERASAGADARGLFFDHTVWREQQPDTPATTGLAHCPDCGGLGDLRRSIGSFEDLQQMRSVYPARMGLPEVLVPA